MQKTEKSLDVLEKAMTHAFWYQRWAQQDSDMDAVRSYPSFQALLDRNQATQDAQPALC